MIFNLKSTKYKKDKIEKKKKTERPKKEKKNRDSLLQSTPPFLVSFVIVIVM
jgi:hypothetical protein